MPDMIDLMASGITSGKKKVKDALEGMTGEMSVIAKANVVSKATGRGATGRTTGGHCDPERKHQQPVQRRPRRAAKSSEAMDKAAGDATGEMARALAFAKVGESTWQEQNSPSASMTSSLMPDRLRRRL